MVKKAGVEDLEIVTDLACQLWGTENRASIREEISALFTRPDAAFFLDWENGEAMGFAQCQLRSDYVEGTKTSPVGYLEGGLCPESFPPPGRGCPSRRGVRTLGEGKWMPGIRKRLRGRKYREPCVSPVDAVSGGKPYYLLCQTSGRGLR